DGAVLADRQRADAAGHGLECVARAGDLDDRAGPLRAPVAADRGQVRAARRALGGRLVRRPDRGRVVGEYRAPVVAVAKLRDALTPFVLAEELVEDLTLLCENERRGGA